MLLAVQGVADSRPVMDDLSPIAGLFGIPAGPPDISAMAAGDAQWRVGLSIASHAVNERTAAESLVLDGETVRVNLGYRFAFSRYWQGGIDLPIINHSSGGLDAFIDDWHDIFGLPDGNRDNLPCDDLAFVYDSGMRRTIERRRSATGIGDIEFSLLRSLSEQPNHAFAALLTVKLPTGEPTKLTGSGAVDVGIGLAAMVRAPLGISDAELRAQGGWIFLGDTELAGLVNHSGAWFAQALAEYKLTQRARLYAGVATHGPLIDSRTRALGASAAELSFGFGYRLAGDLEVRALFSEDVRVDTNPDIVFRFELRSARTTATTNPVPF